MIHKLNPNQWKSHDSRIAAVGYAMMAETVPDGATGPGKIAPGAVRTAELAAAAVTSGKIADGAGLTNIPASAVVTAPPGMVRIPAGSFTMGDTLDGYAGQLFEVAALVVTADSATLDEGGSLRLGVGALLDDDSQLVLAPEDVAWSVVSGPLIEIDAAGLATAGLVYEDTPATARAIWSAAAGDFSLTVLDTDPDNYGSYAGDGLDDGWQELHFGLGNPLAAPLIHT